MELYLEKINRNSSCFSLYYMDEDNMEHLEIAQDLLKERVVFDSVFANNLLELYIMHGENLFLNLTRLNDNHKLIEYNLASHAITVYFLKQLEREGFIKITSCELYDDNVDLSDFSLNFLNFNEKKLPLYTVDFVLTNKKITKDFIEKFNQKIGIDPETFNYYSELQSFRYNYFYQLKKTLQNTFGVKKTGTGLVRKFDKNMKIWNIPIKMFHALCLMPILKCEELIDQKQLRK